MGIADAFLTTTSDRVTTAVRNRGATRLAKTTERVAIAGQRCAAGDLLGNADQSVLLRRANVPLVAAYAGATDLLVSALFAVLLGVWHARLVTTTRFTIRASALIATGRGNTKTAETSPALFV
ncbi:MAG: hypothetical protein AB7G88_04045 [Thermomicrobiales bacterium]